MFDEKLKPIKSDIVQLDKSIDEKLDKMFDEKLKPIKSDIVQLDKKINSRFDYLEASIEKVDRRLAYNTNLLKETDIAIMHDVDNNIRKYN
jgi:hypothetical protein